MTREVGFYMDGHIYWWWARNIYEALKREEWENWLRTIESEVESKLKNKIWKLIKRDIPKDQKVITAKWVFKKKYETRNLEKQIRYKVWLLIRGFTDKNKYDLS